MAIFVKTPFSLKEWLENPSRKVVNEDGYRVRIIATDRKCKKPGEQFEFPIVAIVRRGKYDLNEDLLELTEDGMEYTPIYGYKRVVFFEMDITPKFKVGDRIAKENCPVHEIVKVNEHDCTYTTQIYVDYLGTKRLDGFSEVKFEDQNEWKLISSRNRIEDARSKYEAVWKIPDIGKKQTTTIVRITDRETGKVRDFKVKLVPLDTEDKE